MVSDFFLIGESLVFSFYYRSSLVFVEFSLHAQNCAKHLRIIQGAIEMRIDCLPSLGFYHHLEYVNKKLRK